MQNEFMQPWVLWLIFLAILMLCFHCPLLLTVRCLLPERKCLAVEAFLDICTLTWLPSMSVPAEWRAEMAPSLRSPFSPCQMTVKTAAIQQMFFVFVFPTLSRTKTSSLQFSFLDIEIIFCQSFKILK